MMMIVLMFNSDLSPSLSSSQIFYFVGNLWIEILLQFYHVYAYILVRS